MTTNPSIIVPHYEEKTTNSIQRVLLREFHHTITLSDKVLTRLRQYLKEIVLASYLKDNVNARELRPDGSYVRVKPSEGDKRFDSQAEFEGKDDRSRKLTDI